MPGTAYVLFHHVMGECDGVRGVWGYVRGGMGSLSTALAAAARAYGAQVRVQAEVRCILVRDGRVRGVALADGTEISAAVVVSSCDPRVTFVELLDPAVLPPDFRADVERIDSRVPVSRSTSPSVSCPASAPAPAPPPVRSTAARCTSRPRSTTSSRHMMR